MGTWNTKILSNDDAADIRGTYPELLARGMSQAEIIQQLLQEMQPSENSIDEVVFWIALAACAWDYGNLDASLLAKARSLAASAERNKYWADENDNRVWLRSIEQILEKISVVNPKPKKAKRAYTEEVSWQLGEVIRYTLKSGRFTYLQMIAEDKIPAGTTRIYSVLSYCAEESAQEDKIKTLQAAAVREEFLLSIAPQLKSTLSRAEESFSKDVNLQKRYKTLNNFLAKHALVALGIEYDIDLDPNSSAANLKLGDATYCPLYLTSSAQQGKNVLPVKRLSATGVILPVRPRKRGIHARSWGELDKILREKFAFE